MRTERIGDATLYLGDAVEVLGALGGLDAVITDPPYSSGGQFRGDRAGASTSAKYVQTGTQMVRPDFAGDNRDQRGFVEWCCIWLARAMRASNPGAVCCLFTDWRQLLSTTDALQAGGWVWRGIVPWDKTAKCRPTMGRFASQCEYVVWGSAGSMPVSRGVGCLPGLISKGTESGKEHITQKPVEAVAPLIEIVPRGAVVCDPFMGSGTTGVAATAMGRRFVGIEIEEHYFDVACRRIERAYSQRDMFIEPQPAPVQEKML